tara:strand:- start:84 stop:521 length:438 start_codon:yes stop_codon:yes gene_type:complete
MKKILSISILLFLFACEDDKAEETTETAVNLDGTYKLSEASMECDGLTDDIFLTINGLTLTDWDYDGDECDDGDECYYKETLPSATKVGDTLKIDISDIQEGFIWNITRNGTNGLKISTKFDGVEFSQIWDYESSEIKTYSPICN